VILASAMFPFETYMIALYLTMNPWLDQHLPGDRGPYLIMSFGFS